MTDYLLRNGAPLTDDQWEMVDRVVVETARRILVGRRFIPVVGPFGPGVQTVPFDTFGEVEAAEVDVMGEGGELVSPLTRQHLPLPIIYKDFRLNWRDIESSQRFDVPLDMGPVATAATACAHAEDDLIFHGRGETYPGLLTVEGRLQAEQGDWSQEGAAFEAVVRATQTLIEHGFYGPYALAVSPVLYAYMNRVYKNTGVLEIDQVARIVTDGVFQTAVLRENEAVVVATGEANMDLVVAQDMVTAFLETRNMNHLFRVFEVLALRIKRTQAICVLT